MSRLAKLLVAIGVVVVGLSFLAAAAHAQAGKFELVPVHHDLLGDYTWEFDYDECNPEYEENWWDEDCFYRERLHVEITALYEIAAQHNEKYYSPQTWHYDSWIGLNGSAGWGVSNILFPDGATGNFGTSGGMIGVTAGVSWLIPFSSQGQVIRGSIEPWNNHRLAATMEHTPNWALMLGIEGDIDAGRLNGSPSANCLSCETSNTTLGTLRGVIGLASNQFHGFTPYVTAGLAYGNVNTRVGGFSDTDWKAGYAVGLGATKVLGHGWQIKAEYLHVGLGSASCGPACGNGTARFDENLFQLGFVKLLGSSQKF